ncbi:C39 family peptidase [Lysinibacillus sp. fkY74-1]|nr:C39 family peptidase [Lysinibacillus sphaericus]MBG9757657.1 hypothetical protein [Lysinibacillus sphaericus]QPA55832.1 C39 family peptidase [Lysinibacillus sphaericus]QTB15004.1 C39 family peptidase [Lysinibacillus sphaericus]QTB23892.1 C39 family peptidase [Lysinibacillus sphaericus]
MKKLLTFLFCLAFAFLHFSSAQAAEQEYTSITQAEDSAQEYLHIVSENSFDEWKQAKLHDGVELFDFDGNLTSYVFEVTNENGNDQGYIIVSAFPEFPGVVESTREGSSPYKNVNNGDGIYVGPLLSYAKIGDSIQDLQSNEVLEESELRSLGTLNNQNIEELVEETNRTIGQDMIAPFAATDYSYKLISGVPDYSWYRGCAPTSGANIIKYWRDNGYSGLVQSTTTVSHLIDVLADSYMSTNSSGGTSVSNMKSGMKKYMNDRGYSPTIGDSATFAYHKAEINAGRPSWITTASHPVWGDHAVTGVGFEEYYDTSSLSWKRQIIVHDTWDSTVKDYWISWSSYFDHVISIKM